VPLGGGKPAAVDFALIAASHRSLKAEVEAGRFRADLYYRLNGLTLSLPPLRARGDFAALVAAIIADIEPGHLVTLSDDIATAFALYGWPGNLRQLANVLRSALALLPPGESEIGWGHLPDDLVEDLRRPLASATATPATATLRAASDSLIEQMVAASGGNRSEAARRLGISRNTLYRRLGR